MMTEKKIRRINELAHKAKAQGLTAAEKEEQAMLRREYIAAIRGNIRSQLDQVDVINPDGSVSNLGQERKEKYDHNIS